jgi:hypothetical protein
MNGRREMFGEIKLTTPSQEPPPREKMKGANVSQ